MNRGFSIALAEDATFHAILFEREVVEHYPGASVFRFRSIEALNGSLDDRTYDIIAFDQVLLNTDGIDIFGRIRMRTPDTPIIIIVDRGGIPARLEPYNGEDIIVLAKGDAFVEAVPEAVYRALCRLPSDKEHLQLTAKASGNERLELVAAVASTMSHEINNPLMSILGCVELLLQDCRLRGEEAEKRLRMIEASAQRIGDITKQMSSLLTTSFKQTPVGPMLRLPSQRRIASRNRPKAVSAK